MKCLLAFDSFKESMSSEGVASAFSKGFHKVLPKTEFITRVLSDGGEGFVEALMYENGRIETTQVTGPLGQKVDANIGIDEKTGLAAIEMAQASGLELIKKEQRNPMKASSYGTGELIQYAYKKGCREFLIGIGGSATVDGGCGMAQALGVLFKDSNGNVIENTIGGAEIELIASIDAFPALDLINACSFTIACDVDNPFVGERGAAKVFGPQKGATIEMVDTLERGLTHLATVIECDLGVKVSDLAGAGAAGGIGGMFKALCKAKLEKGIDIVTKKINLDYLISECDLIFTGEGRIDSQTLGGKTVSGVVDIAKKHKKPVVAIGGSVVEEDIPKLKEGGIELCLSIVNRPMNLKEAIEKGPELMETCGLRTAQLLDLGQKVN